MSTHQKYHKLFNVWSLGGLAIFVGLFLVLRSQIHERDRTLKLVGSLPSYVIFPQDGEEFFAGDSSSWDRWSINRRQKLQSANWSTGSVNYVIENRAALSSDGKYMISVHASGDTEQDVDVWILKHNIKTGEIETTRKVTSVRPDYILAASLSADGSLLATLQRYDGDATQKSSRLSMFDLWDVKSGKKIRSFPMPLETCLSIDKFQLSPKGKYFAFIGEPGCGHDDKYSPFNIFVWDVKKGQLHGVFANTTRWFFGFSPDETEIATRAKVSDRSIEIYSLEYPATLPETVDLKLSGDGRPFSVQYSPDSKTIAVGSETGDVVVVNRTEKTQKHSLEHRDIVTDLAFSSDGKTLASLASQTVKLWYLN